MVELTPDAREKLPGHIRPSIETARASDPLSEIGVKHFSVKVGPYLRIPDLHTKYLLPETFEVNVREGFSYVNVPFAPAGMTVGDFLNLVGDPDVLSVTTSFRRAGAGNPGRGL
jgi:hypothetical protein